MVQGLTADDVTNPNYTDASPIGRMLGFPVYLDAAVPPLTASTISGCLFGDLNRAMVLRVVRNDARVDVSHPEITASTMRLTERYADYLQVGYLGYLRADARSNDMRAITGLMANTT